MSGRAVQALLVACSALVFVAPTRAAADAVPLKSFGAMAVDASHHHVFLAGGAGTDRVVVAGFDGAIEEVLGGFAGPSGLVVDGESLYVTNWDSGTIDRIDVATLERTKRYDLGTLGEPGDVVVLGGRVWFVAAKPPSDHQLAFLDPETGDVTAFPDSLSDVIGPRLEGLASDPDTLFVWETGVGPPSVYEYQVKEPVLEGVGDPTVELVTQRRMEHYTSMQDFALSPLGDRVAPIDNLDSITSELDSSLNPATDYRGVQYPRAGSYSPDGGTLAVASSNPRGRIDLFHVGDPAPYGHILLPRPIAPGGLAYSPDGKRLFVVTTSTDSSSSPQPFGFISTSATKLSARLALSLRPFKVTYGRKVTVRTKLIGGPTSGRVRLYLRSHGHERLVDSSRVGHDGVTTFRGTPPVNGRFVARWPGNATYRPSTSNSVRVEVAPKLYQELFGTYGRRGVYRLVHAGARLTYAAQAVPVFHRGRMHFELSYLSYGTWYGAGDADVRVSKKGIAAVGLDGLPRGTYQVWAGYQDRDHVAGFSKGMYFKITP